MMPTKEFKRCWRCLLSKDTCVNATKFKFSCDHFFHAECYEQLRIHFGGSLCPLCFHAKRFDDIQVSVARGDPNMLITDVDNYFGALFSELYYSQETKGSVWINIEQKSGHNDLMKLSRQDIEQYSDFHGGEKEGLSKRATQAFSTGMRQETVNAIRRMFDDKKQVHEILAMRYTRDDILMAGIDMDFLISRGYTLNHIYDLGFRTYQDLLALKMHAKLMQMFYDVDKAFVPVQMLVDYYQIDYHVLIKMFCYDFNGNINNDPVSYQRAVKSFCELNLSRIELVHLRMTNINALIASFGANCFNADCMVEFCRGIDVNDVDTLMEQFRFDSDTMKRISGFNSTHFKELGWDERHPLGKYVNVKQPKQVQKVYQYEPESSSTDEEPINVVDHHTHEDDSDDDSPQEMPKPYVPPDDDLFKFDDFNYNPSSILPPITASPFSQLPNSSKSSSALSSSTQPYHYESDSGPRTSRPRPPTARRDRLS